MRPPKALLAAFAAALLAAMAVPLGCGVESVAPDGCRQIEDARCEAAPSCSNLKVKDVAACKRFYRDQCLHGMTITEDPGAPAVDKCVAKLKECAAAGPDAACGSTTTCAAIEAPERLPECAFLIPPPPTTATGASGAAGAAGSSSGSSGSAGTGG